MMLNAFIVYSCMMFFTVMMSYAASLSSTKSSFISVRYSIYCLIGFFYSLVFGLRYRVGIDYETYSHWFKYVQFNGKFPVLGADKGFELLNLLFASAGFHYNFIITVLTLLVIVFLLRSLDYNRKVMAWYFLFFFISTCMIESLNLMRQYVAFFIVFNSLQLFVRKRYGEALLCFIFAFLFHKSVLVYLVVLPFVSNTKIFSKKYLILSILLVLNIAGSLLFSQFVELLQYIPYIGTTRFQYYINNVEFINNLFSGRQGSGRGTFFFLLVDCVIILYSNKLKKVFQDEYFVFFYDIYIVGVFALPVFAQNAIFYRVVQYFLNYRILMLSFFALYSFKFSKRIIDKLIVCGIVLVMIAFFYVAIGKRASGCAPFSFIFEV